MVYREWGHNRPPDPPAWRRHQRALAVRVAVCTVAVGALLGLKLVTLLPFAYDQVGPAGTTHTQTMTVIGRADAPDPSWHCSTGHRFNTCVWR